MSKKNKVPKLNIEQKKVKTPKFKLITYTLKAVIPTGQYANIQPEITVKSDTIENAERAVMPYIEALFAKYRDGQPVTVSSPIKATEPDKIAPEKAPMAPPTKIEVAPAPPSIILTVPFSRAKKAIESCTGIDALKLVEDQIKNSTKLIGTEKVELGGFIKAKRDELNKK